jgi:catechol 2,3-dioxygenase-like lactoylglutathione lyase family enzyme
VRAFEPTFTVDDIERSERFYSRIVGFVVDQRWNEEGKLKGLLLKAGHSRLGLSQDDWAKGRGRQKGVGFRQRGLDAERLAFRGARQRDDLACRSDAEARERRVVQAQQAVRGREFRIERDGSVQELLEPR